MNRNSSIASSCGNISIHDSYNLYISADEVYRFPYCDVISPGAIHLSANLGMQEKKQSKKAKASMESYTPANVKITFLSSTTNPLSSMSFPKHFHHDLLNEGDE